MLSALMLTALSLPAQEKNEWANFARYNEANAQVSSKPKAVLMGDSITDGWAKARKEFFADNNLVGRGISGQCTAQMLVRFRRDVIELHPKYVVILGGINDIALNNGFSNLENSFRNIVSMCELAKVNKIKPVICTLLPSDHAGWRPEVKDVKEQVVRMNELLRAYAAENHFKLVDYYTLLADENMVTRKDLSGDSIHPNVAGYELMETCLLPVLK